MEDHIETLVQMMGQGTTAEQYDALFNYLYDNVSVAMANKLSWSTVYVSNNRYAFRHDATVMMFSSFFGIEE